MLQEQEATVTLRVRFKSDSGQHYNHVPTLHQMEHALQTILKKGINYNTGNGVLMLECDIIDSKEEPRQDA